MRVACFVYIARSSFDQSTQADTLRIQDEGELIQQMCGSRGCALSSNIAFIRAPHWGPYVIASAGPTSFRMPRMIPYCSNRASWAESAIG